MGFFSGEADLSLLSGQGVFSALLAGILGSILFQKYDAVFKRRKLVLIDGADTVFSSALQVIMPFFCVILSFALANYLITLCFHVQSVQHLFMKGVDAIFLRMHRSYSSGLLFIILISIMWWFGIHGNNVLNQVADDMFTAIIPGEIVSKSFIDTFVNMGGTGCTIGLLVAMLVFGFPVIYTPLMLVPLCALSGAVIHKCISFDKGGIPASGV